MVDGPNVDKEFIEAVCYKIGVRYITVIVFKSCLVDDYAYWLVVWSAAKIFSNYCYISQINLSSVYVRHAYLNNFYKKNSTLFMFIRKYNQTFQGESNSILSNLVA